MTKAPTTMKVCATFESAELTELRDLFGLIGREVDRVADRQACLITARCRAKPPAELRDILVGLHDDSQHDSRPPIEIDRLHFGRDIAALHGHEVGKPNQAVGRSDPRQHRLDGAHIREIAGCFEEYARAIRIDAAGRQNNVLGPKILDQRVELDANRGKLPGIDFQPYALVLGTKKVDLGHARQLVQLFAEAFRRIFHFAIGKSFACYRDGRDRDVAEVAVDEWTERTLRQIGLDVVHLVAQSLPRRVDIADLVLQVDVDDERSFRDQGANVLDFGKLADFALDRDGNEILHPFGRHSGKQCGHDCRANDNDRVFALGEIGIKRDAEDN